MIPFFFEIHAPDLIRGLDQQEAPGQARGA